MRSAFCAAILTLAVADPLNSRITIATRGPEHTHKGWTKAEAPCGGDERVRFTVFLKQRNLGGLLETVEAVSDPKSPRYGQFLSKDEVDKMVGAAPEAPEAVGRWLSSHEIGWVSTADSMVVDTTCAKASALFEVPFHHYGRDGAKRLLVSGDATVPAPIAQHIHFIAGISELWRGRVAGQKVHSLQTGAGGDLEVTPSVLRKQYNVPEDEANPSSENFQAVVAFDDYYSQDALEQFYQHIDGGLGEAPNLDIIGLDCSRAEKPCDQVESDLDVQYMTAMGKGVRTMFHAANTTDGWVLGFSEAALQLSPMPNVFSLSYGWAELGQCDIAVMVCFALGYTPQQYMDRTNANFQKMAAMGSSIFVSDGDDGAQSVTPYGWDPIDLDHWCPGEYTCFPRPAQPSQCANIVLHNTTTGDKCSYPVGHMNNGCSWIFLGDFFQDEDIDKALQDANPDCHLQFFIDGSYNTHMYSACACDALQPVQHKGVVSEPLPKDLDPSNKLFWADFPTSSPFVTSVGATELAAGDDGATEERGASIKTSAIITTGGGFSDTFEMPDYQKAAVGAYNNGAGPKPPSGTYVSSNRGYPDMTLSGHNYQVFYSTQDDSITCPCKQGGVDGTSASSPASAGLISLINGHLLAAGKTPVGFLNPVLYAAYEADPSIFNDITSGDNKCTRSYCMQYGYEATKGWDPVAGLGSIDYSKLKAYILGIKGVEASVVV